MPEIRDVYARSAHQTGHRPPEDLNVVSGLNGHWHRSLELPCGYQHFNWYEPEHNPNDVWLNSPVALREALYQYGKEELYLYTQHEIFLDGGTLKHTRTSPNWEGGVVTYATCKHNMRTTNREWYGTWLAGLCPANCASNTLLFTGRIKHVSDSNYHLNKYVCQNHPDAARVKYAHGNPRGDLYKLSPSIKLALHRGSTLPEGWFWDHNSYVEPPNHTRSIEQYKKSPGSTSDRPDKKIPKWWRDMEYLYRGNRPPSFILSPCFLFSSPMLWTGYQPKRATMKITCNKFLESIKNQKP